VATLPAHRGLGLARGVVLRAVGEARDAGCDLVFLHADDDDWPKCLYGRLGFEPLARWSAFDRPGPA
jgi:GNAT superfamily N-acetyltransferase